MRKVFGGASLLVVSLALGDVAERNKPVDAFRAITSEGTRGAYYSAKGLSHTAYDVLRVCMWAAVIFGVLLIVVGLIEYRAAQSKR